MLFGGGTAQPDPPRLDAASNALRLEFAAPSYIDESLTEYQSRLDGLESEWSAWTREARRDYTNLGFGYYRFRVRARGVSAALSDEAVYGFTILPPWYRTFWAYAIGLALLALAVLGVDRIQRRRLVAKERERSQFAEARLRAEAAEALARSESEGKKNVELLSEIGREITSSLDFDTIFGKLYGRVNQLVKRLVMVPIRSPSPIGAIGAYWAMPHLAREEDVSIIQALADSTSVALENVRIVRELEESRAKTRTLYDHLPTATFFWRKHETGFVLADFNEAARRATDGVVVSLLGGAPGVLEDAIPGLEMDLGACFTDRATVRREVECRLPGHRPQALVLRYGFVPPDGVILHAEDVCDPRGRQDRGRRRGRQGHRITADGKGA